MTLRVAVIGATGRIGSEAVKAVEAAEDLELVAALGRDSELETLVESGAEVAVELTHPDSVMRNLDFALHNGIHVVTGTTGWNEERLAEVDGWLGRMAGGRAADRPQLLHRRGAHHALRPAGGQVLRVRRGGRAAPQPQGRRPFGYRHPHRAADRRRPGRGRSAPPVGPDHPRTARRRGADVDGVPVHAVRLRGLLAHQEVLFGDTGETLTIRHDSLHHSCFMPGILLGVRRVGQAPGLTLGLEHFLDL